MGPVLRQSRSFGGELYDFHNLSPLDFEDLVRDLLQAELGIALESFGPGRDKGIDCRYSHGRHSLIVQAKHYLRSGKSKLLATLKSEDAKVAKLSPSRYIVATSVSMTDDLKSKIIAAMPSAPLTVADIFGLEDINGLLSKHPEIEKNHFKLWLSSTAIIERMLHSGIYNRTDTEMDLIRKMVPKFVQNDSVKEAENILSSSGTLIISGHPGVGKTTLGRMLVWLHASQDWKIFVVDDIAEAFEVSNPGEKRLIFFDDFLGQVQLSADHVRGIDQRLPPFLERVKANKDLRFILTTREYILSQAELLSRRLASRSMTSNRYVLNVGVYTRAVRARILYNHLHFSGLSNDQLADILDGDFYIKIIDHKNFNPRLIELLTSEEYSSLTGENLKAAIERVLANPDELWERPYRDHISADGRALMLALLLHNDTVPFEVLRSSFERVAKALGQAIPEAQLQARFAAALKQLEGSVVAIIERKVRFSNPGVRDFLLSVVIEDGMLASIVAHVETYGELNQCWLIYIGQKPEPIANDDDAALWMKAVERMEHSDLGNLLERLELSLNLFDHFATDGLLGVALQIGKRIEDEGIDGTQVREAAWALENITMHALPLGKQDYLHQIITVATANMLKTYASELPFEDIQALDEALYSYGSDPEIAENAVHAALDSFIPVIDSEMSNFGSLNELDEFEESLNNLIEKRRYFGKSPARDIKFKRERLLEDESNRSEEEGYSGGYRGSAISNISDDHIRSMFQALSASRG